MNDIINVIEKYFNLLYTCDVDGYDDIFDSNATLQAVVNDQYTIIKSDEYKSILSTRTAPADQGEPADFEILTIDKVGERTASAKVRAGINASHYFDYLSLLKIGERWLIVSKVYHVSA